MTYDEVYEQLKKEFDLSGIGFTLSENATPEAILEIGRDLLTRMLAGEFDDCQVDVFNDDID